MTSQFLKLVSRRTMLAAAPLGVVAGAAAQATFAQPAPAEPVSFYLGQVLALATLQGQAVNRLRPLLASPNATDVAWQAASSAEAGVIGAVASVLGVMEPPADLSASVGELRLASDAYRGAAESAQSAATGDLAALDIAGARLAEGATHILLWLDALTAETGNDWGDGLRTLTEESVSVPDVDTIQAETPAEPVPEEPVTEEPDDQQPSNRANRQERQDQQAEEKAGNKTRKNRRDQETRADE